MTARVARHSLRARLALTTAIAGLSVLPGVAAGQTAYAPIGTVNSTSTFEGNATTSAATQPNFTLSPTPTPTQLQVDLNSRATVINWQNFNVNSGNTAVFNNNTANAQAAVLNRVAAGTTTIAGTLTGTNGAEVWISNPNGILIGGTANINTNGLVLTTLDVAEGAFTTNAFSGTNSTLHLSNTSSGSITTTGTGTLTINSNNGVLAIIAPVVQLTNSGISYQAGTGNASFVTASDVTLSSPGSPFSITLNAGTSLGQGTGTALSVAGTVNAANTYFLLTAQDTVDALLNVSANVNATTAGNNVVILAGNGNASPDTPGNVAFGTGSGVNGTGTVQLTGTVNTANLVLGASGNMSSMTAGEGSISAAGALTALTLSASSYGDQSLTAANAVATASRLTSTAGAVNLTDTTALTVNNNGASAATNLTIATIGAATLSLSAAVNATTGVASLSGGGGISLGTSVSGGSGVQFTGPVTLTADSAVNATATGGTPGTVNFSGAVDGGFGLTVSADGAKTFGGSVGAGTGGALTSLTTKDYTTTTANGSTVFSAAATAVTTTGDQNYAGTVAINAPTTTFTGGSTANGTFGSIAGAGTTALALSFGGTTKLNAITGVTTLQSSSSGTTVLNGNVTTTGMQAYNDVVTVTGDAMLSGTTATFAAGNSVRPATSGSGTLTLNFSGAQALNGGTFADSTHQFANLTVGPTGGTPGATTTLTGAFAAANAVTFNNAATLGGDVTVSAGAGGVAFNNTLDGTAGTEALGVTTAAAGTATFAGLVGNTTRLGSLTTTGGRVAINTTAIKTGGGQSYGGATTLGAATVLLDSSSNGNIGFASTVDGAGPGAQALTVNAGGTTMFGTVGGNQVLASLTTDAQGAGGTTLNGNVTTTGAQTYGDPVTLGGNVTLTGTTGTGATFQAASIDGAAHDLTLNFTGTKTINGGTAFTNIDNFTAYGTGTTSLSGIYTTSGNQTYGDPDPLAAANPVVMTGNTTLKSTGNGAIELTTSSTLKGRYAFEVDTGGATKLLGTIGSTATPLTSLITDFANVAGEGSTIGGPASTIFADTQQYNDAVTLIDNARILNAATKIEFNRGLTYTNSGPAAGVLTLDGAGTKLFAAPGGVVMLNSLTTAAGSGVLTVAGGGVTTANAQTYNAGIALGAATTLTGGGAFTAAAVAGGGNDLALNFTGAKTVNGTNFTGIANFATRGGGTTTLTGSLTTSATQSYGDVVTLGSNVALISSGTGASTGAGTTNADISFGNNIDSDATTPRSLSIATVGKTTFGGLVGNMNRLLSLATGSGPVAINTTSVLTTTTQNYGDAVTLGATTASPAATIVTFDSSGSATSGGVTFGGTVDAATADAQALNVSTAGTTSFTGPVGSLGRLDAVTVGTGSTTFNAISTTTSTSVTTKNDQSYGVVLLGTGTGATFTGANGMFGAITGTGKALTLSFTGSTSLAAVGASGGRLASLTSSNGGTTSLSGNVYTSGDQSYADAVTLAAPVTLDASPATVRFTNTVGGAFALTLASNATATAGLGDGTTALASLTTNGALGLINGTTNNVTTTGTQTYGGVVTVTGDAALSGAGSATTFTGAGAYGVRPATSGSGTLTLDFTGAQPLAGGTFTNGADGFANLVVGPANGRAGASSALGGGFVTTNAFTLNNVATLAADTSVTTGTANFNNTIDGGRALAVNAAAGTIFTSNIGNTTPLTSVTTTGTAPVTFGSVSGLAIAIKTNGAAGQSYGGPVTLVGVATLDGGGGPISFAGTIDGARALTVRSDGVKIFGGSVGGTTQLQLLTSQGSTNAALGSTSFGAGATQVRTTANQSYQGTTSIAAISTTFSGVDGSFGAITGGGKALTLSFTGATSVGAIGASGIGNALASLTSDSGGATTLNGDVYTSGAQSYVDNVVLAASPIRLDAGAGTISFASTVGGASALTLASNTTAASGIGVGLGVTQLASLTENGALGLTGDVSTSGTQRYIGAVTLGSDATFTSGDTTANAIRFDGTINSASATARAVTIATAGTTTFGGLIGNGFALASLTSTGGPTVFNAAGATASTPTVKTSGAQSYGAVTLGAAAVFTGTDGTFGAITGGGNALTLSFTGATNLSTVSGVTTLTSNNGGTTTLDGNVTTTGSQTYADNVVLGTSLTTAAGAGAISFNGTLDATTAGAQGLTVTTGGTTTFAGLVGNTAALASLSTSTGPVAINTTSIKTTGNQGYGGAVTLGADTVLSGSGAGATFMATSLNGAGHDLTLDFAGAKTVNGFTGIRSLTTQGTGTTTLSGTITTTGTQTYTDAISLGAATMLSSTGTGMAGNISFGSTIDGAQSLGVTTAGVTSFAGTVGGTTALTSLSTDAAGSTTIGADVTAATQSYGDPVSLTGTPRTLTATTSLAFGGTLTGTATALTLAGAGTKSFAGAVNIGSVATTGGAVTVSGGTVTTTAGGQSYAGLVLGNDAVLTGSGGAGGAAFSAASVTGNGKNLTLDFTGMKGVNGATFTGIGALTTRGAGTTALSGALTTSGSETYNDAVLLGSTATSVAAGAAPITFNGTLDAMTGGMQGLMIATSGTTTFAGLVGNTAELASLSTSTGPVAINTMSIKTSGAQNYGGNAVLGVGTTLASSGSGAIGFTGTVNGGYALAVNTGGTTTFGGAVGNTAALASVTTDTGGATAINGGSMRTAGAQSYGDAVMLGAGTGLSSIGSGAIGFATTIDGAQALTINTAGATTFGGAVGATTALASLTTDAVGTSAINGGSVKTTGAQSYGDPVTLGLSTTLTSTMNGAIGFTGTVDAQSAGVQSLTVNTGGVTSFGGAVGRGTALASLTTDAPGSTAIGGGLVSTTGTQSYNDAVALGAATVLTSNGMGAAGNIGFATTLNGAQSLAINTAGATSFGGAVGATTALASLTTDGAGTTAINGGSVRTTGLQSYGDPVTLGASAILTSTANGAIRFLGTLDALNAGVQLLVVNTGGLTTFGGAVGGGAALAGLTTDAPGSTAINGGVVTTTGGQGYGDAVTLGAATVLTSGPGGVGFATTLDGAQTLVINTAGATSFGGAVGATTALASLATDAGGTTAINGGLVRTSGGQSYGDAVTLGTGTTLSSTNAGAIAFATTLEGAQALALNTAGTTSFGGAVGATTALVSLTTDIGGTTAINGGSVRTTGNQTYNDAVTLGADTRLSSTANGTLGFGNTVDGAYLLSLTTGGAVQASGVLGGSTAINGLALRAGSFAGQSGNRVGTIAANIASGLAYDDAAALTVGTVDGLSGINTGTSATTLSAGSTLTLAANIAAGTTSLTGTGIIQAAGTGVNAGAGTILIDANDGAIAMAGTLTTTNATANAVRIVDSAGAVLGNITTGAGGTVTLGLVGADNMSGNVGQTAGTTITTATLLGSVGGEVNLTNAGNSIATLGAFGANGFTLRDSRAGLAVVGPVDAGTGNLALTLDAGTLALQGNLIATMGIVSLTSGGAISQTGGAITADTLNGSSTGGASLTSAGNLITRLAGFTNNGNGGFTLTDGRALAVTGDTTTAGDLTINAAGIDFTGQTLSGTGALALTGNAGAVNGTTATGGTTATVTGASINLGTVRANNGALALTATGTGGAGLTAGTASASGAVTLASQAALAVTGSLNAGTTATLTATGVATLGQTTAGSSLTVTANLITAGATKAGTMLSFTSGGNINLASAQVGADALFDANGTASLGAVTAGTSSAITVRALDAQITGAQTASKVAFVNKAPTSVAFKLGNNTSAGGFQLSQNEINLVNAGTLTFDGGSGNTEFGALAFASAAGSNSVSVLATGRIDVIGAVSGSGSGRSFLFGGTATATSDKASVIEVAAKPTGGGSLLFDNANLELRGARIGVGQQAGFLTPIGFDGASGQPASTVSTIYVGNANSSLYNSTYGGVAYPTAATLVSANSLTVRYTDYALFQNTGAPGVNAGVLLGGSSSAPVRNALVLDAAGSNNAFALYGTINGINGSGTALLGSQVISFSGSNLANTRVNGCLVGTGGGCLTSVVSQPVLNVFDASRLNVFQSADDLAVPFDPVVGNNNEALFSGVAVLDGPVIDAKCEGSDDPGCKAPDKKTTPPAGEKKGK